MSIEMIDEIIYFFVAVSLTCGFIAITLLSFMLGEYIGKKTREMFARMKARREATKRTTEMLDSIHETAQELRRQIG